MVSEWKNRGDIKELIAVLTEIQQTLTVNQKVVIAMRFGLIDGKFYTLLQVANHLQITRERVRQIEAKALRRLVAILHDTGLIINCEI